MILPTRDQPSEPVQPGKQPLNPPASAITPQRAAVLCGLLPRLPVRCDQLEVVALPQMLVEPIAVVSFVADQPRRQLVEKALGQDLFYQL